MRDTRFCWNERVMYVAAAAASERERKRNRSNYLYDAAAERLPPRAREIKKKKLFHWEDRQLLRSGAVRGIQTTEFHDDDEEQEHTKVTLLVHDTKPPFLDDGRHVCKQ